jgi:hypothetical protein
LGPQGPHGLLALAGNAALLLAITAAQLLLMLLMLPRIRNLGADGFQNQASGPQISDFSVLSTPHASTHII